MSATDSLVSEVKEVLDDAPASRRISILRDMTELFLDGAGLHSKEQIAVFGAVLIAITEQSERDELIELGSKLAPIAAAPPDLMRKLAAHHDIKVSGALLHQCASLSDDDIAEIAATATPPQLMAIANRAESSESITDALISRGDIEILRKCVANERARVSHVGFVKLINAAKRDSALTDMVASRQDLPAELKPFIGMLRAQPAAKQAAAG
ncbi:MAG: DUF2336 domain-containing protein [Xanthobacteraceae bacterium]|nr:DUF2336 domain-containing protein [Xanthobacteraceae bacterium]